MRNLLIILMLMFGTQATAGKYVCNVTAKTVCGELGCESSEILNDDFRIIDEDKRTYEIGTDEFSLAGSETSGAFIFFKVGSSGFIKISTIDEELVGLKRGQFLEVRDTFLNTITSWGICSF
jgi:hypothetical protein